MADTAVDSLTTYSNGIDPRKAFSNHSAVISKSKSYDVRYGAGKLSERMASLKKYGIHSMNCMGAAGFVYTGKEDTVRCKTCGLEVSNWTSDMVPIIVHSARSPTCPYVLSINSPNLLTLSTSSTLKQQIPSLPPSHPSTSSASASTALVRSASISSEQENPSKRQKTETILENKNLNLVFEIDKIQQIRKRTFSHWPHRTSPSQAQMIEAGFFNCNVGDRVICIYCNLICQQWTPHTDDPSDVHKTLSPNCPFVRGKLIRREVGSILIVNETNVGTTSNPLEQFRCNEFVHTVACNPAYSELPKRMTSFASWPNENSPSVDDLVKAGFFYTGTKNIVTCFYCNGSLQNWGPNDNPTIEHARWFPHCAYAKQLCGDELYRKIQESKRAQQERAKANESRSGAGTNATTNQNSSANSKQLLIPDESTLSRLVAARLDLPISQRLLNKNFKLSIIKRCFEDQLRLKHDDFATDADLHMACMILQKQIENIDGKKENITIPSIKMKKIREDAERERADALAYEQNVSATASTLPQATAAATTTTDIEMTVSSQSATNESTSSIESTSQRATTGNHEEAKATKPSTSGASENNQTNDSSPANPCVLCLSEERRLACIPCGHLATCVPCGHSLRSCPICRREIEAFVRIYV